MEELQKLKDYIGAPQEICLSDETFRSLSLVWKEPSTHIYSKAGKFVVKLFWDDTNQLKDVQVFSDSDAKAELLKWGYLFNPVVKQKLSKLSTTKCQLFEFLVKEFNPRFLSLTHLEATLVGDSNWKFSFRGGGLIEVLTNLSFEVLQADFFEESIAAAKIAAILPLPQIGYKDTPKVHRFDSIESISSLAGKENKKFTRFKIDQRFDPMRFWCELVQDGTSTYLVTELLLLPGPSMKGNHS